MTRFRSGQFMQHIKTMLAGQVGAQIIMLGAVPIITRLFGVAEYGAFSVFVAYSSVIVVILTLKLELLLVSAVREEVDQLFAAAFNYLKGAGGLVLLIGAGAAVVLRELNLFLIALNAMALSINLLLSSYHNNRKNYSVIANGRLLLAGTTALFSVSLGFMVTSIGLQLGALMGALASNLYLTKNIRDEKLTLSFSKSCKALKGKLGFIFYMLPAHLCDTLAFHLPVLFFSVCFSEEVSGSYALAFKTLVLPIGVIAASIGGIYQKRVSEILQGSDGLRQVYAFTLKIWVGLALVFVGPYLFVGVYGVPLYEYVFGGEWEQAGEFASKMSFMLFLMSISTTTSTLLIVVQGYQKSFYFGVMTLVGRTMVASVSWYFSSVDLFIYGLVVFETIKIILYNIVTYSMAKRYCAA